MSNSSHANMASGDIAHPYFPQDLILPGYVPNELDAVSLLAIFATGCSVILSIAFLINDNLKLSDRMTVLWFILCGSIHCFFEGYFVYNRDCMPSRIDIFGQLWKEYGLSDSRYIFCDPLLLCMEVLSVFILGPLSFLTAWLVSSDSGYRYSFQVFVSTGHIYSNLLYFATSLYDDILLDKQYYRPEPFYLWAYFVGMNAIWLIIPAVLLYSSMRASAKAFAESMEFRRKVKNLYDMMKESRMTVTVNKDDKKEL